MKHRQFHQDGRTDPIEPFFDILSCLHIVRRPLPENDPKQRQPDISDAQKLLDWKPHVALKDGLVKTIEYFEKLLADRSLRDQLSKEAAA
jgi:nucleoside-diphosphate-sugar epimerase